MKLLWSHSSRRVVSLFLCAITMVYLTGCNLYKVAHKKASYIRNIESNQFKKKLFLHNGNEVFQIKNYTVLNKTDLRLELVNPAWDTITVIHKAKKSTNMAEVSQATAIDTVTYPPYYYTNQTGFFEVHTNGKVKIPHRKYSSILQEVHLYTTSYLEYLTIGENMLSIHEIQEARIIEDGLGYSILTFASIATLVYFSILLSDFDPFKGFSFPDIFTPK